MKPITDENYKSILDGHFENKETIICSITTSLTCPNCISTKNNYELFCKKNKHVIPYYHVDYTKYDILQNYHQLNNLYEFPHTIVFYGNWEDKEFLEGIITVDKFEEILITSKKML